MNYTDIQQRLKDERKTLAIHQENLNDFLDKQAIGNFVDEDTLRAMISANESVIEKYNYEFNRLISEIRASGERIADLNLALKKEATKKV